MEFSIAKAKDFIGKEVTIKGWVYNKRSSGKITFLQIRDGSGFIQGVVEKVAVDEKTWEASDKVTMESSALISGIVKEEPRSSSGVEMTVKSVEIINLAPEFPIGKKDHGPEFLF